MYSSLLLFLVAKCFLQVFCLLENQLESTIMKIPVLAHLCILDELGIWFQGIFWPSYGCGIIKIPKEI
jgi:hypothetical protein